MYKLQVRKVAINHRIKILWLCPQCLTKFNIESKCQILSLNSQVSERKSGLGKFTLNKLTNQDVSLVCQPDIKPQFWQPKSVHSSRSQFQRNACILFTCQFSRRHSFKFQSNILSIYFFWYFWYFISNLVLWSSVKVSETTPMQCPALQRQLTPCRSH